MRELTIKNLVVNDASEPFVIAEIGNNHGGDLDVCKQMIKAAAESGASAVKLQKRHNQTLYTKSMLAKEYDNPNSYGPTYGEHREFLEMGIDHYPELIRYSEELGVIFFSTAFDFISANQLNEVGVPAFKMASGDLKSIPLLKHVARFGKPMIISTGGATLEQVREAYEAIMPINKQLAILQCTAGYPPKFEELNLKVIETYRKEFPDCVVGYSGHDSGIAMALASYMLGARVIEKHFTLNRAWKGTDHAFSLEPQGMRKMIRDLSRARVAMGNGIKDTYECEKAPILKMGKKIVFNKSLKAGHIVEEADLALKTPADGLEPKHWESLIGKKLNRDIGEEENLLLDFFES